MRILGIDCGSRVTGYGLIDTDGTRHKFVAAGAIETKASDEFAQRLYQIGARLRELVEEFRPEEAAVEDTFTAVNARSALKLTHVRGVALFVCAEAGMKVGEYSPAQVKLALAGNGRAEKQQVEWMVRALLGLAEPIAPLDASDAVAVAICHATQRPVSTNR